MIELGFHVLMFANNVKYELRHYYYKMITLLFEREELKLTSVGYLGDQDGSNSLELDPKVL